MNETGKGPLLFDGAMATYYASVWPQDTRLPELALLDHPERIEQIHREYLEAGAQALKTCTFSLSELAASGQLEQAKIIIPAACQAARQAVKKTGGDAQIFADLGPAPVHAEAIWKELAEVFLQEGIHSFLLETLPSARGVEEFAGWLKQRDPQAFVQVSFACGADSFSIEGFKAADLLKQVDGLGDVDAIGLNCMCGPAHLLQIIRTLPPLTKPLAMMPNAGYPTITRRQVHYTSDPEYFGSTAAQALKYGVSILGGCCGTTPAHIRRLRHFIKNVQLAAPEAETGPKPDGKQPADSRLWQAIADQKKIIAVELDPPANDQIAPFLRAASQLHQAGADLITLADCPIGRPRADSCLLACKIKRELGIDVLPHMTCRDRNLNAARALLLGLAMEDIHNILLVTGDPIPQASRQEVKSVFSYHSRRLAQYVRDLYPEQIGEPFHIFGALDVNTPNFEAQLAIAREKEASGMIGFLTQPILSQRAIENLKKAREQLQGLILGGIYPVVSWRNACFLHNEISGMHIDPQLIQAYEGKDRAQSEALACRISERIMKEIDPYVDGFYLMTPFFRIELISEIITLASGLKKA